MKRNAVWVGMVLALAGVAGCSSESVRRGAFEGLQQKQCMDTAGTPNCAAERKSYDQYQDERGRINGGKN